MSVARIKGATVVIGGLALAFGCSSLCFRGLEDIELLWLRGSVGQ